MQNLANSPLCAGHHGLKLVCEGAGYRGGGKEVWFIGLLQRLVALGRASEDDRHLFE